MVRRTEEPAIDRALLILMIVVAALCVVRAAPAQTRSPRDLGREFIAEGTAFPALRLPDLRTGEMTSLESLIDGRRTVLHVFASW